MTTSPHDLPSDEQLAALATREACQALYDRHAPDLLAFLAARSFRGGFEDLHHETWLRVWKCLPGGFRGGNFRAWLFAIARNLVTDLSRRPQSRQLGEGDDVIDKGEGGGRSLEGREERELLQGCLERLEKRDPVSAALMRGLLGGEGYDELCPRLELTRNEAYRRRHEAVKQLQDCVGRANQ